MKPEILVVAICLGFASGCATVHSQLRFQGFGDADLERDARVVEDFRTKRGAGGLTEDVKLLIDTIPEGIKASEGTFSVEEGYQHEIVGKLVLVPGNGLDYWITGFPDYEDGWRKGVCYWQVPLHWLTFGTWQIVPTSYPCVTTLTRSKIALSREAKAAAAAAGADTAIVSFVGGDQENALGATGLLLRLDPRMKKGDVKTKPIKRDSPAEGNTEI